MKATEIIFLVDQSGSMQTKQAETFEAFEEFIEEQKHIAGDCYISVYLFNTQRGGSNQYQDFESAKIRMIESKTPIDQCGGLGPHNFRPEGGTPIVDAVGISVDAARFMIPDDVDRQVVFVLMTDGEENSSTQYTLANVHDLITYMRKGGWKFVYIKIGDSFYHWDIEDDDDGQAAKLGFLQNESFLVEEGQIKKAVSAVSHAIADYRTTGQYKEIAWTKSTLKE